MNRITRLGIDVALLAAFAATMFYARNYYAQFFRGPELVETDQELLDLASVAEMERRAIHVELRDRTLIATDWEAIGTSNGAVYSTNPYYLIDVAGRRLLVLATKDEDGKQLVGPLQLVTGPVDRDVWQSLQKDLKDTGTELLPVILNSAAAFRVIGYLGLVLGVTLITIVVFDIARTLRRR